MLWQESIEWLDVLLVTAGWIGEEIWVQLKEIKVKDWEIIISGRGTSINHSPHKLRKSVQLDDMSVGLCLGQRHRALVGGTVNKWVTNKSYKKNVCSTEWGILSIKWSVIVIAPNR